MQLSQLLNMKIPTSPIPGKAGDGEAPNAESGLFDSLLEMYFSPDKLVNNKILGSLPEVISDNFINEIEDELQSAEDHSIFF